MLLMITFHVIKMIVIRSMLLTGLKYSRHTLNVRIDLSKFIRVFDDD
jgi:hypothetical protein